MVGGAVGGSAYLAGGARSIGRPGGRGSSRTGGRSTLGTWADRRTSLSRESANVFARS